jgi:hypothetical protein
MSANQDYIKQTSNVKLHIVTKPRTYVQWVNDQPGRDKTECYEREVTSYIRYVNVNNPRMIVIQGDKFFDTIESLYNLAYAKSKLK